MAADDPRQIAFTILRRVDQEGAYSSVLLQHVDPRLAPRDMALVTELVYGVLRRRLYLDHVIAAFSSRPVERVEPDLVLILRMALYQILSLTRIPPHAAVNEAVAMSRRHFRSRPAAAASFVNGLLRTILREPDRVPAPPVPEAGEDPAPALAIAESHPVWLVRRWIDHYGPELTAELLAAQNRPAPVAMRVTSRGGSAEQVARNLAGESIATRLSPYLDDFLVAIQGAPQRTEVFRRGEVYIQDEASGLVARLAGTEPEHRVLDACAAPGGKALYLAQRAGPRGLVVAADRHVNRLRLVDENARRLGLDWCLAVAADLAEQEAPFASGVEFDTVLVDAPCSGTGVIRRNPELRYRLSIGSLRQLAGTQARLLGRCAARVSRGGSLTYSVCSLEPEEGIEQIRRFLGEHADFTLDDPSASLPRPALPLLVRRDSGACLETLPHRDGIDGFFAARLRRQ